MRRTVWPVLSVLFSTACMNCGFSRSSSAMGLILANWVV